MSWYNPKTWGQESVSLKSRNIDEVLRSLVSLQNTAAGEPINESTAFKSPTFYAAVSAISRTLASLPLDVIRTDGDETIKDTAHPLYKLLVLRPNEWQSRYEYWATAATSLLVHNVFLCV